MEKAGKSQVLIKKSAGRYPQKAAADDTPAGTKNNDRKVERKQN